MKKVILISIAFLFILASQTYSQMERSAFKAAAFSTSYLSDYQCLGINPANLGWIKDDKAINLGLFEFGLSVVSDAIQKTELRDEFITKLRDHDSFTLQEKYQAASEFLSNGLAVNLEVAILSFSYQSPEFGGIAFSIRERTSGNFKFNDNLSNLLFLGRFDSSYFDQIQISGNDTFGVASVPLLYSELFEGARLNMIMYMEYCLGYGRTIYDNDVLKISAGIGLKFIQGFGIADMGDKDGEFVAYSALSPGFDIDYGKKAINNPSYMAETNFKSVGTGFGLDFGVTVVFEGLKAGIAVNDIGSITWDGNVFEAPDTLLLKVEFQGFDNYNIVWEAQKIYEGDGLFNWEGLKEKKVKLPANFRAGASYTFAEKFEIGFDLFVPISDEPGSYDGAIFGIGGNIRPIPWLELSTGFVGGGIANYSIPLGICFSVLDHSWEMGVSTRDAMTWLKQDSPHLSASFGFLRFRF